MFARNIKEDGFHLLPLLYFLFSKLLSPIICFYRVSILPLSDLIEESCRQAIPSCLANKLFFQISELPFPCFHQLCLKTSHRWFKAFQNDENEFELQDMSVHREWRVVPKDSVLKQRNKAIWKWHIPACSGTAKDIGFSCKYVTCYIWTYHQKN